MLRARYLPIYVMWLVGGVAVGWVFFHGEMDANDWFAVVMIVATVALGSAFAWDIIHPILDDKPQRQEFLDDDQVQTARAEAEEREYDQWVEKLKVDKQVVRDARRALEAHPRAWLVQPGRLCGDGSTCDRPGEWGIAGFVMSYCATHAAERIGGEQL